MQLSDLEHLRERDEIAFKTEIVNGEPVTIVAYMVANPQLWTLPNALECRGITFNAAGECISRPFKKFFNVNEREDTQLGVLLKETIAQVTEKRDGSMITPALIGGQLFFKTKKSFYSSVAQNAQAAAGEELKKVCRIVLDLGYTPIFEYTDPRHRIVIDYGTVPEFTLLAIRRTATGELIDYDNLVRWAEEMRVGVIPAFDLRNMEEICAVDQPEFEGYVVQFTDDRQVKIKTEWYKRNHHLRTDIRERDIADMVIDETLDDVKAFAVAEGYDISVIERIEERVNAELVRIIHEVKMLAGVEPELSIKEYALKYNEEPLFGLAIGHRKGAMIDPRRVWTKEYRAGYTLNTIYSTFREE